VNTLLRRLIVDARSDLVRRCSPNPKEGKCWAHIKLGQGVFRDVIVHCSFNARKDGVFCGHHDHLNVLFGESVEDWLAAHDSTVDDAFRRAFVG